MLKKLRKAADNNETFGALLTDLLKVFNCFNHELLIAKLRAYSIILDLFHLKLVYDYLLNCKHRTKVNPNYSSWDDNLEGVQWGY